MKLVTWEDGRGYKYQSYLPDNADDNMAPSGVPHNPPDLGEIDWTEVEKEIHNALVEQGLITWQDVMKQQNTLVPVIVSAIKRRLLALYRKKEDINQGD